MTIRKIPPEKRTGGLKPENPGDEYEGI